MTIHEISSPIQGSVSKVHHIQDETNWFVFHAKMVQKQCRIFAKILTNSNSPAASYTCIVIIRQQLENSLLSIASA